MTQWQEEQRKEQELADTTLGVTSRHGSIRDNTGSCTGDGGIGDVSNGRSVWRNSRGLHSLIGSASSNAATTY